MISKSCHIFLWVIHLTALLGIALGNEDFFLTKSPFTIIYIALLLIYSFPVLSLKKAALFLLCFTTGMVVEWIGVHTQWLFGDYYYGNNMGYKLDGIPYLIGVNWAVLSFITYRIASKFFDRSMVIAAAAASLMVLLDFFLEQVCSYAGFWYFKDGAGWYNYVCWWIIAFTLQIVLKHYSLKGDFKNSLNIYLVQLIFTAGLWILITI